MFYRLQLDGNNKRITEIKTTLQEADSHEE
jgi:hypothetical protein